MIANSVFHMPDTVQSALHLLIHFILTTIQKVDTYSHFIYEEIKVHIGCLTAQNDITSGRVRFNSDNLALNFMLLPITFSSVIHARVTSVSLRPLGGNPQE